MNDARVWVSQCTADIKVPVSLEELIAIFSEARLRTKNPAIISNLDQIEAQLGQNGRDYELKGLSRYDFAMFESVIRSVVSDDRWVREIGGSPAISAIADYEFTRNGAEALFAGNLVETVMEALIGPASIYAPIFTGNRETNHRPGTFSLEIDTGAYKIMFPFSEGRELGELYKHNFLSRLRGISSKRNLFIGLGGLNKGKPEQYSQLVQEMRECTDFSGFYVGTNSFARESPGRIHGYLRVCYEADVVSFNDAELRQVYAALGGSNSGKSKSSGQMLLEIDSLAEKNDITPNPNQLKVCHASCGAIIYPTGAYRKLDPGDLGSSLGLSVDATSIKYQSGSFPSAPMTQLIQTALFQTRQESEFTREFGLKRDLDHVGIIYAVAPRVKNPRGTTTGLGGNFDGVFASTVSPYILRLKR